MSHSPTDLYCAQRSQQGLHLCCAVFLTVNSYKDMGKKDMEIMEGWLWLRLNGIHKFGELLKAVNPHTLAYGIPNVFFDLRFFLYVGREATGTEGEGVPPKFIQFWVMEGSHARRSDGRSR